jgi:hypothetical protein
MALCGDFGDFTRNGGSNAAGYFCLQTTNIIKTKITRNHMSPSQIVRRQQNGGPFGKILIGVSFPKFDCF